MAASALLLLSGCSASSTIESGTDEPQSEISSTDEEPSGAALPGEVLNWTLVDVFVGEDGTVDGFNNSMSVQILGTPSPQDIAATAKEIVSELRRELGYLGMYLDVRSEPLGAFPETGFYLGYIVDTPFGLELDRIDEVNFEGYETHLVEVVAWKADWANVPSATDYTIWLAYKQALSENPIDLDAGDVDGQRESRDRTALISVSNDFDIDDELVLSGYTRFDNFTEDYETYEFEISVG